MAPTSPSQPLAPPTGGAGGQSIESWGRYGLVPEEKEGGVTYTPSPLATFVAGRIARMVREFPADRPLRLLDPAVGHGELLVSLLRQLQDHGRLHIEVDGFEVDREALSVATRRIRSEFPGAPLRLRRASFLDHLMEHGNSDHQMGLLLADSVQPYDLIIANPPYVRTQVMGSKRAKAIARQFGLSGRVDLYYAFLLGIAEVLAPGGVAGIIVSNRFMTTKSGAPVRRRLLKRLAMRHVWDLGDTKLFDAAVLPAVLLARGRDHRREDPVAFTSVYETQEPAVELADDPISALERSGVTAVPDGRRFNVCHGRLHRSRESGGLWRLSTDATDRWLSEVESRTWGKFGDLGKVRVGVKTCADHVFIRRDWDQMSEADRPELLRPLTTHRVAGRFRPRVEDSATGILYPHEVAGGRRRAVDLARYPRSAAYLEKHREALEARQYLRNAGRRWYEIWVPQDPASWELPKLVFRDITERPTFWMDLEGSVVNGDCYWLACEESRDEELLWLAAAVGNSNFIEQFYDIRFPNKLYSGRRRFITQYVREFPLPDPSTSLGRAIIDGARRLFGNRQPKEAERLETELNGMVWRSLTDSEGPSEAEVSRNSRRRRAVDQIRYPDRAAPVEFRDV